MIRPKLIRRKPLKHDRLPHDRREMNVTICVAARAGSIIVCASDRMLSSGDIQFEPARLSKTSTLTSSIGIMQAGDAAFNSEIMWGVTLEVAEHIKASPSEWLLVSDIADMYVKYRNTAKTKRAEKSLLSPLGLTLGMFRDNQHQLKDDIADQITRDLINYDVPHVSVIITGIDPNGPHIYVVDDGNISCNDVIGFAAIGIGARHAETEFMLGKHSWSANSADAALLTYFAKKKSEISPRSEERRVGKECA